MKTEHNIKFTKTQKKMMDCWYACIQMIRSTVQGSKTKPEGEATKKQRARLAIGRTLDFDSTPGTKVLKENNLVDVGSKIKLDSLETLGKCLQTYGPLIVGGKFGFFNTQGHFMIISGCDSAAKTVVIYDPAWGAGRDVKPWEYITKHCYKMVGSDDTPHAGTFIADDPNPFFDQPTRARSTTAVENGSKFP